MFRPGALNSKPMVQALRVNGWAGHGGGRPWRRGVDYSVFIVFYDQLLIYCIAMEAVYFPK